MMSYSLSPITINISILSHGLIDKPLPSQIQSQSSQISCYSMSSPISHFPLRLLPNLLILMELQISKQPMNL